MKKIPTIFVRNPENMKEILNKQNPACKWVFDGEGSATRKYDGACCAILTGKLFKRREIKQGEVWPANFIKEDFDAKTGKTVGWVPVDPKDNQDRYFREAFCGQADGTYELLGPKVQGNPEKFDTHTLLPHADTFVFDDCPREFEELKAWLIGKDIEGIVFHHLDGRMAKIKKRDFGLKRSD